ncbi:hypothetical protein NJB1604_05770 [Mycobacterium marinum]|nr:hypothetical protein NJB1604_05770 [Mycobacterium marinum]
MRVVVDRDRCEGNAFCVNIAPEVFILDDDEYAVVIAEPVPCRAGDARRAGHHRVPSRGLVPRRLEEFSGGLVVVPANYVGIKEMSSWSLVALACSHASAITDHDTPNCQNHLSQSRFS